MSLFTSGNKRTSSLIINDSAFEDGYNKFQKYMLPFMTVIFDRQGIPR